MPFCVVLLLLGRVDLFNVVLGSQENKYDGVLWLDRLATLLSHSGRGTLPFNKEAAIHVLHICAMLLCMYGSSIFSDGLGCRLIMVKANKTRGPHSLECGVYVTDLQLIQTALGG